MKYPITCLILMLLNACAVPAQADLILTLNSGSSTVVVIDESPSSTLSSGGSYTSTVNDSIAGSGIVGFTGAVGSFVVNVTTGISRPLIGPYAIDLNNVSVSGGAGTLTIGLIDTGFLIPSAGNYSVVSEFGGTTDGFITSVTGGILDSNAETGFGADTLQGPFGPGSFSGTRTGSVSLSNTFSMNTVVSFTHGAAGQITSFDHKFSVAVPEPATGGFLLAITCLIGLRRRR